MPPCLVTCDLRYSRLGNIPGSRDGSLRYDELPNHPSCSLLSRVHHSRPVYECREDPKHIYVHTLGIPGGLPMTSTWIASTQNRQSQRGWVH